MRRRTATTPLLVLSVLALGSASPAQYLLTTGMGGSPPNGAFIQIGNEMPLPALTPFPGGTSSFTGGPSFWPPLPIVPTSNALTPAGTRTIMQTGGTPAGGAIQIPASILTFQASGTPNAVAAYPRNSVLFQVATTISYAWPSAAATLAPGGGPGTVTFSGPGGGTISYFGGAKAFGGPATFALRPGPLAGTHRVPPNGAGALPLGTFWINASQGAPSTAMVVALAGFSSGAAGSFPALGGSFASASTNFGPVANALHTVNAPSGGGGCTMWCVGPAGTVVSSGPGFGGSFPSNRLTSSVALPFTTGQVSVFQPGAIGGSEFFFLSGADNRVSGLGNVSLVSGGLSTRSLAQSNANRAWVSLNLPEPSAALAAASSLGVLALCHSLVRRRRD